LARRLTILPRAKDDIRTNWRYLAERNEPAADRWIDRIDDALRLISEHPEIGRARPELGDGLRSFSVENYVLFLKIKPDSILVVCVMHARQDIQPDSLI
jgi:toxin ParE1/3/4